MALISDSWHHWIDALTGIAVVPVFVLSMLNISSMLFDLAVAVVIAVLIMNEEFEMLREAVLLIIDMGRCIIVDRVTQVIARVKDVIEVHDVRVRNYGILLRRLRRNKDSRRPNKNR